jgi:hypothetical protein
MISHKPHEVLQQINKFFPIKKGSVGPPGIYFGVKMSKVVLPNQVKAWAMSASKYVQEAVRSIKDYME